MTETKNNFIAGEWLAGDNSIENRNPSDLSDIIGHFAQASSTQLDKALDAAKALAVGAADEWRADGYTCEVERVPDRPIFEVADHTESPDAWFRAEVTRCLRPRD